MGPRSHSGTSARLRPLRSAVSVVLAVVIALGLATALPSAAVPLASAAKGDPPRAGEDFPRLPGRCYRDDRTTLADGPCRILTFGKARPTLLVWGDSHGWMYLPALRRAAKQQRVSLILVIAGGCPPALPLSQSPSYRKSFCESHNERTLDYVTRLDRRLSRFEVIIAGFWSGYRQAYRLVQRERAGGPDSGLTPYAEHRAELAEKGGPKLFRRLGKLRIDVDVLAQAGTVPADPPPCTTGREPYQCDLLRPQAMDSERSNRRWLREQMTHLVGRPRLIDPSPAYCSTTVCRAHVNGANTFFDDIHLAAGLTRQLTDYFLPSFTRLR